MATKVDTSMADRKIACAALQGREPSAGRRIKAGAEVEHSFSLEKQPNSRKAARRLASLLVERWWCASAR